MENNATPIGFRKDGTAKLPRGAKRFRDGTVLSAEEMKEGFGQSVLSLPLSGPLDATWKEVGPAIDAAMRDSRIVANFIVRSLAVQDIVPLTPDGKINKFNPDMNAIYAAVGKMAPQFSPGSTSGMDQQIKASYMKERFWNHIGKKSLRSYTSFPIYIRGQDWKASLDPSGRPVLEFRLGSMKADGVRGERIRMALSTGREFQMQREQFLEIESGRARSGDLRICRTAGGKLMARINYTRKRQPKTERPNVLHVRTLPKSFLEWRINEEPARPPYHADDLPGILAQMDNRRQRLSDDLKFEKRWPADKRARVVNKIGSIAARNRDRLTSFYRQAAAMIVGVAMRRQCGVIRLDTAERGFIPHFPWAAFVDQVRTRAVRERIEFFASSGVTQYPLLKSMATER